MTKAKNLEDLEIVSKIANKVEFKQDGAELYES